MEVELLDEAIELIEKANADLEPELLTRPQARTLLERFVRIERLGSAAVAQLTRKLDDPGEIARTTGTSLTKAKETVATGRVLRDSAELSSALQGGELSLEQAAEIA